MPVIRAVILWIKTGSAVGDSYRYPLRSDSTSLGRGHALGQTAFPPFLRPFGLWNRQKIALGFVLFVVPRPPATGLGARRRPPSTDVRLPIIIICVTKPFLQWPLHCDICRQCSTVVGGYSDTLGDRKKCHCNRLSL